MTVALILDFAGASKQQYDDVVQRMKLGGQTAPGCLSHVAGSYEGGLRVIDIWESIEDFERFRDAQIIPHTSAVGLSTPSVQTLSVNELANDSPAEQSQFVQHVILPGLNQATFTATRDQITPDGKLPAGVTFHVNGLCAEGWYVIDGWTSKDLRDQFMSSQVTPAMSKAKLSGELQVTELTVLATLKPSTARVHA